MNWNKIGICRNTPEAGAPAAPEPVDAPAPPAVITEAAPPAVPPAEPAKEAAAEPAPSPSVVNQPIPLSAETLKLPEGVTLPPEQLSPLIDVLNDANLAPVDRGQKLLDLHIDLMKKAEEAQVTQWVKRQEEAAASLRAHPEMGGKNLPNSIAAWNSVLTEFGTRELRASLDRTGLGNDPEFGAFLLKIAKVTSEGKPVVGAPTSGKTEMTAAQKLYPTQGQA